MSSLPCKRCIRQTICGAMAEVNSIDNSGKDLILKGIGKQCNTLRKFLYHPTVKINNPNPKFKIEAFDHSKINEALEFYKLDPIPINESKKQ